MPMQNETHVKEMIRTSLLDEVYTTPKPGLVDLHDNGAHTDMDVALFERSTEAIVPFLYAMYEEGMRFAGDRAHTLPDTKKEEADAFPALFYRVRETGKEAERAMFRATNNVNTHKGMIFSAGLLLTAAGTLSLPAAQALCDRAAQIASFVIGSELAEDAHASAQEEHTPAQSTTRIPQTHGETVRRMFHVDGVRGEALSGFPALLQTALPALLRAEKEGLSANDARVQTLLSVMTVLDDTNVYMRGGEEAARFVKSRAKEILENEQAGSAPWHDALKRFNEECIKKNISPGGAADMLALALLVSRLSGNP